MKTLACRICSVANACGGCCSGCTAPCNGKQMCSVGEPYDQLIIRAELLDVEITEKGKQMQKKLPHGKAEATDPALHMEMETLRAEREARLEAEEAQDERERMIAQSYELAGQIKAVKMISKFGDVTSLMWLKQVKESKIYKELPGIGTWEKYCEYVGVDRHTTDQNLLNLAVFGEAFIGAITNLRVGYRELRQLRQLKYDGESFQMSDDGKTVVIEGEAITLGEDAGAEIEAALEKLLEKNKTLRERNTRLEKDLKGAVKEEVAGLAAEKTALVQRVKELEQYEPTSMDETRFEAQYKEIMDITATLATKIANLMKMDNLEENPVLAARVEGMVASVGGLSDNLREEWRAQFQIY